MKTVEYGAIGKESQMKDQQNNSSSALPFWILVLLGIALWFVLAYLPLAPA